jgi:hypothetical protein
VDAIASQEGKIPTLVSLKSGTYLHYVCVVFSLPLGVQSFRPCPGVMNPISVFSFHLAGTHRPLTYIFVTTLIIARHVNAPLVAGEI